MIRNDELNDDKAEGEAKLETGLNPISNHNEIGYYRDSLVGRGSHAEEREMATVDESIEVLGAETEAEL